MFIRYFDSTDERRLKEQCDVMFDEVSSGVYYVKKDRLGIYADYITFSEVAEALNKIEKVAVTTKRRIYANFDVIE